MENLTPSHQRPITISLQVGQQHATYQEQRKVWIAAEDMGVDTIFNWDHLLPPTGDPNGTHLEAYTLLAAMAEVTQRVQLGCLVTCNAFRNPDLLADMVRTIDHISDGRAILGIGAGWNEEEFRAYGYSFDSSRERLEELDAALQRISSRMHKLNPGPVNGKIPILIGGSGEQVMLGIVARHADMWHLFGDAATVARKITVLDAWCEQVERPPADIERAVDLRPSVQDDLDAFVELGITHFTVAETWPDFDLGYLREIIAWRDGQAGPTI